MYSRIFVLILAVGIGVGIGALTISRLASDDPSVEGLLEHTTESLVGRLTQGESSELDPEQLARVVESLIQILDEEISGLGGWRRFYLLLAAHALQGQSQ